MSDRYWFFGFKIIITGQHILHCVSKKFPPLNSVQLCQILTDFQNFCTAGKRMKFATKPMRQYPPHLRHVATLPWEIKNSNFLQIRFPAMQKVWKSVKIWQSYREFKGGNFFETLYRVIAISCGTKISAVHHLVLSQYKRLTDGRTNRQTGGRKEFRQQYRALHYMQSHGKNAGVDRKCGSVKNAGLENAGVEISEPNCRTACMEKAEVKNAAP